MTELEKLIADAREALPAASTLATAPIVATGLIGGWLTARVTKVRPLGGVVLAAAGALAARSWYARGGAADATALTLGYLGAFGLSHPLAKKVGPWPSVLGVTAAAAAAAHYVSDHKIVR
ncbi:hypothetical protein [Micrococcoides hystricis]|uniref:Uncharacterized protein n=1 Tax=Micrococcoides hystricis TaxID=1572761 RepID=A0ABV6P9U1_9MICC